MKKLILLLIIISMSGCYITFKGPRNRYGVRPYIYSPRPHYNNRVIPGKIYRPYFRSGRW